jgi:predicted nucleic acid-binding protein
MIEAPKLSRGRSVIARAIDDLGGHARGTVEADFDPIPFDAHAARAFGRVAASLRQSGMKTAARGYDAMIAATAIANGLPLYTSNPADFEGIEGLRVVPVQAPAAEGRF